MNEIVTYFAYGSNLLTDQMTSRCPGAHSMGLAELAGWQFRIGERGVATIIQTETGSVWGGLWGIPADQVSALDRAEGVHNDVYRREILRVETDRGPLEALVCLEDFIRVGKPRDGYVEKILTGTVEFGLPAWYQHELATWA